MVGAASPRAELPFRARRILYAVITEYVATGEPVGSRKLARRYGLNLSPATIRNVLADLEDAGYLHQPHTSAGRIPTDAGFRVFVDALVQMREVTVEDRAAIVARMQQLEPGKHDIMRETGKLLSALTGAATLLSPPRLEQEQLSQMRFVPLREGQMLAVLVTEAGTVQNRVVRVSETIDGDELERVHNLLSELVGDRTLREVREELAERMATERDQYDELRQKAQQIIDATLQSRDEASSEVLIEGQKLLFDRPEFVDSQKIRAYLETFEEKQRLLELLDRTLASGGVQVLIGAETELGELEDISLVSANYGQAGTSRGALGVIGPTRMDYAKVVPLVEFTARVMGQVLDGGGPEPDDEEE